MNIERSSGLSLLPQKFPPPEALVGDKKEYERLREKMEGFSEEDALAILWTIALQNAFEEQQIAQSIPGVELVSYGFADPDVEDDAFGAIVYTAPVTAGHEEAAELRDERVPVLKAANLLFPVFIRQAQWEFHSRPVHPANGTAACWARSRKPALKKKLGLLTAKHVVGPRVLGNAVLLTQGFGTLADLAPEGIDAALIQVPKSISPHSTSPLPCQNLIAQWTDVEVRGRESGVIRTKVVEVTSSRGSLHYSIPLRIFLATPGQPGDSGSLVVNEKREGIGIYMGSVTSPTNQQEGFCQHLGQAADALSLDLML